MNKVKYPEVDPKSVDHASREDQIEGYIDEPDSSYRPEASSIFFMGGDRTIHGMGSKGVPQTDKGGFVGRPHGWER